MSTTEHSDFRVSPRRRILSGKIPGRVYAAEKALLLRAKSYDISKTGLGLVIDAMLSPGDRIWLITDEIGMKFEVRHCGQKKGVDGYFCGLVALTPGDEVESLYAKAGII